MIFNTSQACIPYQREQSGDARTRAGCRRSIRTTEHAHDRLFLGMSDGSVTCHLVWREGLLVAWLWHRANLGQVGRGARHICEYRCSVWRGTPVYAGMSGLIGDGLTGSIIFRCRSGP